MPKVRDGVIALKDIGWDPSIYPRESWNPHTITVYVDGLRKGAIFPPLVLEDGTNRLLDGLHRKKAYEGYEESYEQRQLELDTDWDRKEQWALPVSAIPVEWHTIPEGIPPKLYAAQLSAIHGDRLTQADKRELAREICESNPDFTLESLSEYLHISLSMAGTFVSDIKARRREEQLMIALRLHRLGWTQEEMGDILGYTQNNVHSTFLSKFPEIFELIKNMLAQGLPPLDVAERMKCPLILVWAIALDAKHDPTRMEDLKIPVQPYDVWTFGQCNDLFGRDYPGRIPGQLLAQVLYFFTKPGDMVIDPMAGSGTTPDVCLAMGRECYAYDANPLGGRHDILKHNMADGWPDRVKKADLIFWDPPYFSKKDAGYSDESISRLPRDRYLEFFAQRFKEAKGLVKRRTTLAFLMSDWNLPYSKTEDDLLEDEETTTERKGIFLWDYAQLLTDAGWTLVRHIQAPLSTQSVHADTHKKFKARKRLARLERYLLIAQA